MTGRAVAAIAIIWSCVVWLTAWRLTHPNRHWRPRDWQPSDLPTQALTLHTEDDIRLSAWIAPQTNPPATVICVHGWGTNHTEMEARAQRLFNAGYSVMLFDFRACGESEGTMSSAGVWETRDLRAAVHLAATHTLLNSAPIVILANSMGAAVAIAVAAEDSRIRALFSDAAYASLENAAAWGFSTFTGLPSWPFKTGVRHAIEHLTGARMSDLSVMDAIGNISPRPVLIAHGADDPIIAPHDAHALFNRAQEPKELWIVPDAGHVVAEHVPTDAYDSRVIKLFTRAAECPAAPR